MEDSYSTELDSYERVLDILDVPDVPAATVRNLDAETLYYLSEVERFERGKAEEEASSAGARVFTFYGPVTGTSVYTCMQALGHWARRDTQEPIKVIFASGGGSVYDGFALYDFLREISASGSPVETVALGFALSMGAILLQAGDHRVIGRNAYLMIHGISFETEGDLVRYAEVASRAQELQDRCITILSQRSKLSERQIKKQWKVKRDGWWLNAEEALSAGLVDEVR